MKEERKEKEEEWKGGREGCLAFRGILISFLGCYTSRHCLRFAISPLTCHAVWAHSSPAEQNYLAKQWFRKPREWCSDGAYWLKENPVPTCRLLIHQIIKPVTQFQAPIARYVPEFLQKETQWSTWIHRRDVKSNLPCSSCIQEPMLRANSVWVCAQVCVCASFLPSCCCADQCCHLFHWPACDGAPLNL